MWTLRRASSVHLIRNRGLISGTGRICYGKSEIARCLEDYNAGITEPQEKILRGLVSSKRFRNTPSSSLKSHREFHFFSSKADAKSSELDNDDNEDGFIELGTPIGTAQETTTSGDESDDDLISTSELSEEEGIDGIQNDVESAVGEKKSRNTKTDTKMTKAILASPASPVSMVLEKWVKEGNEVTQTEVSVTMLQLRRRRMFIKALQLSEWVESTGHLKSSESTYASRVDLIAKVRGVNKAEEYFHQLPESFKNKTVYHTLLANCVSTYNMNKSEELFNKMKTLGLPTTCFACNQMLLLYKRMNKRKISNILLLMEKENIKPSLDTYQVLIDAKGQSKDIAGVEQIVKTMKAQGLRPNTRIQALLARHYAACGFKDKAESILKEIEGESGEDKHSVYPILIPLFASLGKEEEVDRIWKACESSPRIGECMAFIEAYGRLGNIEKAEGAFNKITEIVTSNPSSKHFLALLDIYAQHKMLEKGKDLVKRMEESGCIFGPHTWDAIVKLFVEAGEVEEALSLLEEAIGQRGKPLFNSYNAVMEKYAFRGDVHNAEKVFFMMKRGGFPARLRQYKTLLQAYRKVKMPVYGFRDRMKADNVFLNKAFADELARVDPFRKSDELGGMRKVDVE